ncbi:MAG TPA: bidirectional hydrogenase complex protein HoxU [Dissulfurispiraceae bacterium]
MNESARIVTFKMDGRDIGAREDETILHIATENGIFIPTLCYLEGLSAMGGCRLCMVEIKDIPQLAPSCLSYPREGMEVVTNSERLAKYRVMLLELFFAERVHICAVCVANGRCELQGLAFKLGMMHVRFPYFYPRLPMDASHERFVLDHNRCILCTRCVRVCAEIEGAHTLDVMGRGMDARIITDLNQPWGTSMTCTRCGKCVNVCPTGALSEKGKAVADPAVKRQFLPYLTRMRRGTQ